MNTFEKGAIVSFHPARSPWWWLRRNRNERLIGYAVVVTSRSGYTMNTWLCPVFQHKTGVITVVGVRP